MLLETIQAVDSIGAVRRSDLYLRAQYPEVETTIYRTGKNDFKIFCDNVPGDFHEFEKNFNHSIRLIYASVQLTNLRPLDYLEVIPCISDKSIGNGHEGIPMSKHRLFGILITKFPDVKFYKLDDDNGVVSIYTAAYEEKAGDTIRHHFLNNNNRAKLKNFLTDLKLPITFNIIEQSLESSPESASEEPGSSPRTVYSKTLKNGDKLKFVQRDESLWYDNIEKIFSGSFRKEHLYFYNPDEYSCYVDYSVFPNLDIRNHLFLFQTVFVTLPFERDITKWLSESKIHKNEFFELIRRKRIKILLTQPEYRYDLKFLCEIYEVDPNALITRRALSTLQQIDLVEVSDNYLFNDINIIRELHNFCEIIGSSLKTNPKAIYDLLVWPISARRQSFEHLEGSGILTMGAFGVNKAIEKQMQVKGKRDVTFDFMVNAHSIHLAHALNAIYFPFTAEDGYNNSSYTEVMGNLLNFYKNATPGNIKQFIEHKRTDPTGTKSIQIIDAIEVNNYMPILELEEILDKDTIFPNSKRLMESLASLSGEERKSKIDYYNQMVNKKINRKRKSKNRIDLSINGAMDILGHVTEFTALGTTLSVLKIGGAMTKSLPLIKHLTARVEQAIYGDGDKANIHYLTKINRAAKLKPRTWWGRNF
ncbi:MAG TPA: hypothetical protein PLM56_05685 [Cyclobacteriaceae bacterium]|nr:hypothetical protein [Cytophagales bacterium]HRE67725.1 hypothetical protein [Cyclobacteriaceae bacterium]HRF32966.1 hypothetical protein [Cyclobacteriaceae bacterium]